MQVLQKMQKMQFFSFDFFTRTALKCSGYVTAIKIIWGVKKHKPNILYLITDQLLKLPLAFIL